MTFCPFSSPWRSDCDKSRWRHYVQPSTSRAGAFRQERVLRAVMELASRRTLHARHVLPLHQAQLEECGWSPSRPLRRSREVHPVPEACRVFRLVPRKHGTGRGPHVSRPWRKRGDPSEATGGRHHAGPEPCLRLLGLGPAFTPQDWRGVCPSGASQSPSSPNLDGSCKRRRRISLPEHLKRQRPRPGATGLTGGETCTSTRVLDRRSFAPQEVSVASAGAVFSAPS